MPNTDTYSEKVKTDSPTTVKITRAQQQGTLRHGTETKASISAASYNEKKKLTSLTGTYQSYNADNATPVTLTTGISAITLPSDRQASWPAPYVRLHCRAFHWPHMAANLNYVVQSCTSCVWNSPKYRCSHKMQLFPASKLLDFAAMNIVVLFPKTFQGYQNNFVINDQFSKLR